MALQIALRVAHKSGSRPYVCACACATHAPPLPSGEWQTRWKTPERNSRKKNFKRKIDADRLATSVEHHLARGDYVDPSNGKVIFEPFAWEWFSTTASVRASTRERDQGYLERYILPTFGRHQLAAVDFAAITKWVAKMRDRCPTSWAHLHRGRPRPLRAPEPQRRDAVTDALEKMARAAKPMPMAPVEQIRPS
jgi:hypothetical protein